MTREEYLSLYEKFLAGNCSEEEKELLANYMDEFRLEQHSWEEGMGDHEAVKTEIYERLQASVQPARQARLRFITRAAAAVLAIVAAGTLLQIVFHPFFHKKNEPSVATVPSPSITPGGNKATLTLANGQVIVLDSTRSGVLAMQNGVEVRQTGEGQVIYGDLQSLTGASAFNTISTPIGGQFQVTLEDGTKVWLNATSSLRFPARFSANERAVQITGEAYFEVTKNEAKPFRVTFNGNIVTVLGTHFNIMAYPDEARSKVTLLEGAVDVSNQSSHQVLKPGMQAVIGDLITVRKANTEEAVAWKNGYFVFDQENIQSIMRKIARWYDVTVVYEGDMRGREFSGTISRFKNVSEVLDMLELTESVHFHLQGKNIKVTP